MSWTKEDEKALLSYKTLLDSDDIRIKEIIKKVLLNNKDIIHVLNNENLNEEEPDSYFGKNILPYYIISPTQTDSSNFICFEVGYSTVSRYNKLVKVCEITFYILCEQDNIIYNNSGLSRHDLLAALLINQFNWKDYFGNKIRLVSDTPNVQDDDYAMRVLIFQMETDNNIVKTINGKPKIINQEIHYASEVTEN